MGENIHTAENGKWESGLDSWFGSLPRAQGPQSDNNQQDILQALRAHVVLVGPKMLILSSFTEKVVWAQGLDRDDNITHQIKLLPQEQPTFFLPGGSLGSSSPVLLLSYLSKQSSLNTLVHEWGGKGQQTPR